MGERFSRREDSEGERVRKKERGRERGEKGRESSVR